MQKGFSTVKYTGADCKASQLQRAYQKINLTPGRNQDIMISSFNVKFNLNCLSYRCHRNLLILFRWRHHSSPCCILRMCQALLRTLQHLSFLCWMLHVLRVAQV